MLVARESDCHAARRRLEHELHEQFELEHTTLQVDHEGGELLNIEMPEQTARPTGPASTRSDTGGRLAAGAAVTAKPHS